PGLRAGVGEVVQRATSLPSLPEPSGPRWIVSPLPDDLPAPRPRGLRSNWVLLTDRVWVGHKLEALLEARGERCVRVRRAPSYALTGPDEYQLHPSRSDHLDRLLRDVFADDRLGCGGVVHLWSLEVDQDLRGLNVPLDLLQIDSRARRIQRILLVTRGLQA